MEQIMDHIGIYVNEDGYRYPYKRMIGSSGLPNYYPPPDKNDIYRDMYIDEVLFITIPMDTFNTDREHRFFGFRYFINSSGHETISLGPDPLKLGVTRIQLTVEVQRFRYYIKDKLDIVIERVFDPLYPPRIFNTEIQTSLAGKHIQDIVDKLVASYNLWYVDKQV